MWMRGLPGATPSLRDGTVVFRPRRTSLPHRTPAPSRPVTGLPCESPSWAHSGDREGGLALAVQRVYAVGVLERPLQFVTKRPALSRCDVTVAEIR